MVIITQAHRAGIPRATILRMVANVGIDAVLGAIPIVGDLFDIAFQANTKNLELYRTALRGERQVRRDWGFLAAVLLGVAAIVTIPILLLIWAVRWAM
jgi:hypothetical protein